MEGYDKKFSGIYEFLCSLHKESSHQPSDDEEGVDKYNPPAAHSPTDQSITIGNNII